jgi:uncharacterized protein (TIGR00661 family)
MKNRVLVTPLDWGLGHATRCIPIIQELIALEYTVYLAGSGPSLDLLKKEFPSLTSFHLAGYNPRYFGRFMVASMVWQLPRFILSIRKEHRQVNEIVSGHKIDFVISDNRYGAWSKKVPSFFITHQLTIQMPSGLGWLSPIVNWINTRLISNFRSCWVPDTSESLLSGGLSVNSSIPNIKYTGVLSRMKPMKLDQKYDVACILSGPEPQRSEFEKLLFNQLKQTSYRCIVVRGVIADRVKHEKLNGIEVVDYLGSGQLNEVLAQSSVIIARSGYSTIMDLTVLKKKAIFVPTPGQTEQQYLAERLQRKMMAPYYKQSEFKLLVAMQEVGMYSGMNQDISQNGLKHFLGNVLIKEMKSV